jgi:hypothetical protein
MKFITVPYFITAEEASQIINFNPPRQEVVIENEHIKTVNDATKGWSVLCDLTNTEVSNEVAKFQGDATLIEQVPEIFHELAERIAHKLSISSNHVFFQYIMVGGNGEVRKHYDAGKPGYITYKCNICVSGPSEDVVHVDDLDMLIGQHDLYCFEANLYKHWMDKSDQTRVHLSYGFLLPYSDLGWEENSPRIRLSNRIWRAYIGNHRPTI